MFVVVIDRLRQRLMTALRILFLLALVVLLTGQLFGLFRAGEALRSGQAAYPAQRVEALPGRVQGEARHPAGNLIENLTRNLRQFYMGHQ